MILNLKHPRGNLWHSPLRLFIETVVPNGGMRISSSQKCSDINLYYFE